MKIISWNLHFDSNSEKYEHILKMNPDILILLECTKSAYDEKKNNWKYKNWYNDDLNSEYSDLGVSIFSNKYPIEMSDYFNRNYRYVIPYKIKCEPEFFLFVTWTKRGSKYEYSENIFKAIGDPNYREYFSNAAMLIGDFNFATTEQNNYFHKKLMSKDLINTVSDNDIYKPTYFHNSNGKYYTNDYCFVTKTMSEKNEIETKVLDLNKEIEGINKYENLSDHCPIIVTIKNIS